MIGIWGWATKVEGIETIEVLKEEDSNSETWVAVVPLICSLHTTPVVGLLQDPKAKAEVTANDSTFTKLHFMQSLTTKSEKS